MICCFSLFFNIIWGFNLSWQLIKPSIADGLSVHVLLRLLHEWMMNSIFPIFAKHRFSWFTGFLNVAIGPRNVWVRLVGAHHDYFLFFELFEISQGPFSAFEVCVRKRQTTLYKVNWESWGQNQRCLGSRQTKEKDVLVSPDFLYNFGFLWGFNYSQMAN